MLGVDARMRARCSEWTLAPTPRRCKGMGKATAQWELSARSSGDVVGHGLVAVVTHGATEGVVAPEGSAANRHLRHARHITNALRPVGEGVGAADRVARSGARSGRGGRQSICIPVSVQRPRVTQPRSS